MVGGLVLLVALMCFILTFVNGDQLGEHSVSPFLPHLPLFSEMGVKIKVLSTSLKLEQ